MGPPTSTYWTAISIICTTSAFVEAAYPKYEPRFRYPLVRNKPYDFPTFTPLTFTSSLATPVDLPALRIDICNKALLLAQNDGQMVFLAESRASHPCHCEAATLTGGPVFNDKYVFAYLRFVSDGFPNNTRSGGTFDGKGFPLQFRLIFYKKCYGSFNNSLNYRDGLVTIPFPVIVQGNWGNRLFTPFQDVLSRVRRPYSTAFISAEKALYWLLASALTTGSPFYSYPGAYRDYAGRFHFCSIDIHPSSDTETWISYPQFDSFQETENTFGQPQVSSWALHPFGPRPFVETRSPVYVHYHNK